MLPVTTQNELFKENPLPKKERSCPCWGGKKKGKHKKQLTRYDNGSDSVIYVKAKEVLENKDGK